MLTRKLWYHPESESLFQTFDGKHPGDECDDVTGIEKFEEKFVNHQNKIMSDVIMTPEQKIKATIMAKANYPKPFSDKNYAEFIENDSYGFEEEFRCSGIETGLPCEPDRDYESYSVAAEMSDGSWVGWTYWFGGGKHSEPESIEWMSEAYEVESWEEMQLVRKFKKSS